MLAVQINSHGGVNMRKMFVVTSIVLGLVLGNLSEAAWVKAPRHTPIAWGQINIAPHVQFGGDSAGG